MKRLIHLIFLLLTVSFTTHLRAQLPEDFPSITTELSGETGDGPVFLAVATEVEGVGYYLILLENDGTILNYKELADDYAYDFKMQPNGQLSYAKFLSHHSYTGGGNVIHRIMDRDLNQVDSIQLQNGYIAEAHDFQALPNGHFLAFGYYLTKVDMSEIIDGAHPAAFVSGGIVQEFDSDKNLVWQWRSWDHYDFEDYNYNVNRSKGEYVSAFHLNTIGLDYDGHLLLASPSWTMKINRQTGETIWNLGGDDNEFSFVGIDSVDAVGHLTGHAFYRLENGNYLIYDNGGRRNPNPSSEVHEYSLDQENKVATHVWTYARTEDEIAGWHRGNAYRLPNGNTIIGWGGADGDPIPTATEVDENGNVVFEAFFDNPEVESYRAFRFDLDVNTPYASDWHEIITPGGDYDFIQGDTLDTGIAVHVDDRTGDGYNTLEISRYNHAPMYPVFPGRAPMVYAKRIMMETTGISSISGQIIFNVDAFNIYNPEDIVIYRRDFEGNGLFIPLATSYNHVTGEISADFDAAGEFIIAWPELAEVALPAKPVYPIMGEKVNQELPITMEWAPDGFFEEFNLQIATDEDFTTVVLDETVEYASVFDFSTATDNTNYYWRVKTLNGAGESVWSDTAYFTTSAPMIEVRSPNGAEEWQVGLDYWIKWNDNLEEDVIVELYKNGVFDQVIDTVESKGAFEWSLPLDLATGTDYSIQISSLVDESILDVSDAYFTIMDTTGTFIDSPEFSDRNFDIYPNPSEGKVHVSYRLDTPSQVSVRLFDLTGRLTRVLYEGFQSPGLNEVTGNLESVESNPYVVELRVGNEVARRIIIIN
jgi:hypothetical protein